uniref:Uncharacterized protein n=1 Tax=Leersia perrieri TaxID=77586 RepID=A0A0D9WTI5_9ORYZ
MLGGIVPVKLLAATSKTVRLTRPEMSTPVMSPTKLFDRRLAVESEIEVLPWGYQASDFPMPSTLSSQQTTSTIAGRLNGAEWTQRHARSSTFSICASSPLPLNRGSNTSACLPSIKTFFPMSLDELPSLSWNLLLQGTEITCPQSFGFPLKLFGGNASNWPPVGIGPSRSLYETLKTARKLSSLSTEGIIPVRRFQRKSRICSLARLLNSGGMPPLRELADRLRQFAGEHIVVKIKRDQIGQLGNALRIKPSLYLRLHIKKVVRELAGEVVAAGAENAQPRAVAETGGDDPTEQIHGEIKNGDLRAAHAQRRDRAMEAVVAGIQRHEAWRVFPDRGREFPLQEIARHVEQLEREAAAGNGRQWRQLLTSTTVTLDRENTTSGSSPERLFLDRLRYMSSVRLPIDGEIVPASPRPGSHSRVTAPPPPPSHPTPSHVQQSGEPCHSATMPSPAGGAASARNDSNASLSASKHAAARPQREAVVTSTRIVETTTWQLISIVA